jgi:ubiquinone/menaquinone biosynthesis C-methylase UbiE
MTLFNWKEVWDRKGKENTNDLYVLDGHENTNIDLCETYKKIYKTLEVSLDDVVLEIGCGAGGLSQFFNNKCNYYGCDYSEYMIEKNKNLIANTSLFVCEAESLPFDDNFFDKVFAFSVFQYFPGVEYAIKSINEMFRVSKNGCVFIGDLATQSHDSSHLLFDKKYFNDWDISEGFYNKDRFNVYKKGELK